MKRRLKKIEAFITGAFTSTMIAGIVGGIEIGSIPVEKIFQNLMCVCVLSFTLHIVTCAICTGLLLFDKKRKEKKRKEIQLIQIK